MGQRHQLYVIAKADGRYRTLAALHKQWSYSIGAIARCQLVMQVFRANASLVKQEIQKAEKLDWQKEVEAEGVKGSLSEREMNLLFPFIATCLIVGAGDKWLLPITIVPTDGDNNDGITVLDITDPDMPRYAFVSLPVSEHDGSVQRMIPQDAIEYLKIYRDREDPFTSEDEDIAKDVAASPLIDAETLQSAWPTLKFHGGLLHRLKNLKWPRSTEPSGTSSGTPFETGSLRGRTMREVIFKALDCNPNELSWIEEAASLPDFDDTLRTTLFEQPQLQEKPSGVALLTRVLKKAPEVHVDLRPFFTLKPAQVLDIIQSLDHSVAVSLPPMPDLTLDNLHELLQTGKLRELHMGDTPNLGLQEALDAISCKQLAAFSHPSLYRLPIELMYVSPERREERLPNYPIDTESGFPVSQLIFLQSMEPHDAVRPCVAGGDELAWTKISPPEAPGRWNGMSPLEGPIVIPITLRDSLLSLDRVLEQLPEIVADLSSQLIIDLRGFIGLARAGQDAATKHLALRRDKRLLPIPARLYNTYRTSGLSSCERPPVTEAVKCGEWSLLALHEAPYKEAFRTSESEIRYAFVTLDDNEQLLSVSVDEFVRTLSSNEIYGSGNSDARAELVRSFEERMAGTCEGQTARVSHTGLSEVIEAMRLTDVHRAQVEEADEVQGKFRRHKRREFEE
ncbi:hypothetical protein M409DRAFT_51705 [Zasmidium cellare ATCC 36951]|uniref:Uncharacterized protein n=1 Tax=Zasmidium cellare ATCC 36951 TaxID=1080233 RepID=A0A6A6CWX0_ZASCE|nr:uncharacterized protein M409DRAFT_51705 [Zasmidium cellare ATCC 36951]KAF2170708.1 hypothetical protein M409DRAFT_51705 [Zasmidium cellare ATCC 36951]